MAKTPAKAVRYATQTGPLLTAIERTKALRPLGPYGVRNPHSGKGGYFVPADGVITPSREKDYAKKLAEDRRDTKWYRKHKKKIARLKFEECAKPIENGGIRSSLQVRDFTDRYNECRGRLFRRDPWTHDVIEDRFEDLSGWKIDGQNASDGVRKSWTFEKGFQKIYRKEPAWADIDFDEKELAPEEIDTGKLAETWIMAHAHDTPGARKKSANSQASELNSWKTPKPSSSFFSFHTSDASTQSKRHRLKMKIQNITAQWWRKKEAPERSVHDHTIQETSSALIRRHERATNEVSKENTLIEGKTNSLRSSAMQQAVKLVKTYGESIADSGLAGM